MIKAQYSLAISLIRIDEVFVSAQTIMCGCLLPFVIGICKSDQGCAFFGCEEIVQRFEVESIVIVCERCSRPIENWRNDNGGGFRISEIPTMLAW